MSSYVHSWQSPAKYDWLCKCEQEADHDLDMRLTEPRTFCNHAIAVRAYRCLMSIVRIPISCRSVSKKAHLLRRFNLLLPCLADS